MLRRRLARHRRVATGLLLLMAAIAVAGVWMPHGRWLDALRAASRAGFIGGIADWFAVTALFRRPLGLPIPHTAVIPREKARLGRALGGFIANQVFTEAEMLRLVGRLDLPGELGRLLDEEGVRAALVPTVAGTVPRLLKTMSDGSARRAFSTLLPALFDGPEMGRVFARALRALVEGQRHQAMVSFVVGQLRVALASQEERLRAIIAERVREQGGRLVGWALGGSIAGRVLTAIRNELDGIDPDGSEIREAVTRWIEEQIAGFEADPARAIELGRSLQEMLRHDAVTAWGGDVWGRLRSAVERDAERTNGHLARFVDEALARLGALLREDASTRGRVDAAIAAGVVRVLPGARVRLADFIGSVVANWDDRMVVDRLELRVGRDLQYIRINGTLVGFIVGALVFACLGNG
jgi:uncharacterized membrane-anchored protein YjiN (DUF445 family)